MTSSSFCDVQTLKSINLKLCSPRQPTRFLRGQTQVSIIYIQICLCHSKTSIKLVSRTILCLFRNDGSGEYQRNQLSFRDYKNFMENDNQCQYNCVLKQVCSNFEWDSLDLDEGFRKPIDWIVSFFQRIKLPQRNVLRWTRKIGSLKSWRKAKIRAIVSIRTGAMTRILIQNAMSVWSSET